MRVAPDGEVSGHVVDRVGHGLALHGDVAALHDQPQRFFFEIGLLHQPVRQAPQQIEMRAAAFVAARPQPDVIGQQQRDAAFAFARQHQERLVVRALHHGGAGGALGVDQPEPAAPVRRIAVRAFEPARHRMALAGLGEPRVETAAR